MATKVITPANTESRAKLDIRPGDNVRVWQKIEEAKGKFRLEGKEYIVKDGDIVHIRSSL